MVSALLHEKQREGNNLKPKSEKCSLQPGNNKIWSLDKPAELHGELGLTDVHESKEWNWRGTKYNGEKKIQEDIILKNVRYLSEPSPSQQNFRDNYLLQGNVTNQECHTEIYKLL